VVFGASLGAPHLGKILHEATFSTNDEAAKRAILFAAPLGISAAAVAVTAYIVAIFYCLGALHNERRDRSILFWKSLPVSDVTTVSSKALIPLAVLPAVTFVVILLMHAVMLLLTTVVLALNGIDLGTMWSGLPLLLIEGLLIYSLVVVTLWLAPVYAWTLLVSSAASKAPLLWLVLPPLAVMLVEGMGFRTHHFWDLINSRVFAGPVVAFSDMPHGPNPTNYLPGIDPVAYLASPALWAGLVFAALALGAAIWLRRYREPV
jgi:ABC-2 type transport system permease protein